MSKSSNIKIYKQIVFSKTPLKGHYRFKDVFQIYPFELKDTPGLELADDFPLVIEFKVENKDVIEVHEELESLKGYISKASSQINSLNKLTRLFSSITNHRIFTYSGIKPHWGVGLWRAETEEEKKRLNDSSSQWILPHFSFGVAGEISAFAEQKYANVTRIDHQNYYVNDPVESKKGEITLPETIDQIIEAYNSLSEEANKITGAVSHLICNGIDLRESMKSISFISFVSSIETLVDFENRGLSRNNCTECGRPIISVTQKFKRFLVEHVSSTNESIKKYNRIYSLRSRIAHQGGLLLGDETVDWTVSTDPKSEWMIHLETQQLCRVGLANWLIFKNRKLGTSVSNE